MKLVIVIPYFHPKLGGLENYAFEIAQGLNKFFKWKIWVITSRHKPDLPKYETYKGIQIIRLNIFLSVSNTPINPFWYWQIKHHLKKINPDIVNMHTPVPFIADMGIYAARNLNIPTVLTYQNDLIKDNFLLQKIVDAYYLILGRRTLHKADHIIVSTLTYAQNSLILRKHLNKITVISPGIYVKNQKIDKSNKEKFVLFVGQIDVSHAHKGLDVLIKAVAKAKRTCPDLKLKIIGEGNNKSTYITHSVDNKISNSVVFLGRVTDAELSKHYSSAICLCLPSTNNSEGFGMVILEAAERGTPSVGSNIGGIPSVIVDGKTGLLTKPGDVDELCSAITLLYSNQKLREKLGEQARMLVKTQYTWEQKVKNTNEIFRKII